jgi:nicotinamide-nucleotide amidase
MSETINWPDGAPDAAGRIGELAPGLTIATAESITAGLVGQSLAAVPGSMDWFLGGVVAYQREVMYRVLGVLPGPVVTRAVAEQMARGVARLLRADVAVATTGAEGPEALDGAPPGTVVVGIWLHGRAWSQVHEFAGGPSAIVEQAARAAVEDLATLLDAAPTRTPLRAAG